MIQAGELGNENKGRTAYIASVSDVNMQTTDLSTLWAQFRAKTKAGVTVDFPLRETAPQMCDVLAAPHRELELRRSLPPRRARFRRVSFPTTYCTN